MHVQLIDAALRRGLEVPSELVGDEIDPSVVPKSVSLSDRGGASPDNSPAAIDYLPIGRLTRAPVLLSDINLDVAGVNDLAFSGQLEFDLFVDADGSVARIEVAAETELERRFSERVVQHFKAARFRPGEVDGKVSASLLRIVVVSGKPTSDDGMR